nr:hypothetical protein [Tanacetum cinerariifolium]
MWLLTFGDPSYRTTTAGYWDIKKDEEMIKFDIAVTYATTLMVLKLKFVKLQAKKAQRWFNHVHQTNENAVEQGIVTCFSPKLPKVKGKSLYETEGKVTTDHVGMLVEHLLDQMIATKVDFSLNGGPSGTFLLLGLTRRHSEAPVELLQLTLRWKVGSWPTWFAADMILDKVVDYIKREMSQFFHCS